MITNDEAITLLEMAASNDKRTIGKTDVMVWREVSKTAGWTFQQAARALIEHISFEAGVYLTPAHVTKRIAEVRKQIQTSWQQPPPPRELADRPAAEIAWRRSEAAAFAERNLDLWADGEPFEEPPSPVGDLNVKRGELPPGAAGDSLEKLAALAEIARFTKRTVIESTREQGAELRAQAAAARRARWEAVDGCALCDDEGARLGTHGHLVVCNHVELAS